MNPQLYAWLLSYKFDGWLDGKRDVEKRGIYDSESAWKNDYAIFVVELEKARKQFA